MHLIERASPSSRMLSYLRRCSQRREAAMLTARWKGSSKFRYPTCSESRGESVDGGDEADTFGMKKEKKIIKKSAFPHEQL